MKNMKGALALVLFVLLLFTFFGGFQKKEIVEMENKDVEKPPYSDLYSEYRESALSLANLRDEVYSLEAEMWKRGVEADEMKRFIEICQRDPANEDGRRIQEIQGMISALEKYILLFENRQAIVEQDIYALENLRREILPRLETDPFGGLGLLELELEDAAKRFKVKYPAEGVTDVNTVDGEGNIDWPPIP
jgi:hypothetical protein